MASSADCIGWVMLFSACLGLMPLAPSARATPELVVLMRHGHKGPGGSNYNLSAQGFERANALASLLPHCFGRPSQIRSFYFDPISGKNARSYQTAVPLAVATGVDIAIDLASREDSFQSGRQILTDPSVAGGKVVLFWEHRRLPQLAAGLGWPGMAPIADDDFDQLVVLRYQPSLMQPEVRTYSQAQLLNGQQRCEPLLEPRRQPRS
jgi:hypothetical protein